MRIFLFFILLFPFFAKAESLKICAKGISECENLVSQTEKYAECMKIKCPQYYNKVLEKNSKLLQKNYDKPERKSSQVVVNTCEYGLRKCDSLSDSKEYYWECIADSCKNPDYKANPACDLGINLCVDKQEIYDQCMKFSAGSELNCAENLRIYWQCVYEVCLGPVDKYMKKSKIEKILIVKDKNGKKKPVRVGKDDPIATGAPLSLATAPVGVDPEEWVRSTPQKFLLKGNPASYMRCLIPTAILDCEMDDLRSCRCSDGSAPIVGGGVPSPDYKD